MLLESTFKKMNMINKKIAQSEVDFFGGSPEVYRYYDEKEDKSIDVLCCYNVPQLGVQSCATIGLNATNIGLVNGGKSLRVELLGASDCKNEYWKNIMATTAFEVMDSKKCFPGYIVEDVVNQYISGSKMKHVLLTNPFLWEEVSSLDLDEIHVAWLMMVPISDKELKYAQKYGVDALETLFEKKQIDIYDIYRKSVK